MKNARTKTNASTRYQHFFGSNRMKIEYVNFFTTQAFYQKRLSVFSFLFVLRLVEEMNVLELSLS